MGRGYTASADLTGLHSPDIDGHTITLVMTLFVHGYGDEKPNYREAAYGSVKLLVRRDSTAVADALEEFESELYQMGKDKSRTIVRFHT